MYQLLMTEPEQEVLGLAVRAIPRALHGLPLLEIGAGVGGSTATIARALKGAANDAVLRSIDNCTMDPGRVRRLTGGETSNQYEAIHRSISGLDNVSFEPCTSLDALGREEFTAKPFALVLIDGDHRYESALRDFAWADHVAFGGLLVAHDIGKSVTTWGMGPTRALLEWLAASNGWRMLIQVQSLAILQREIPL